MIFLPFRPALLLPQDSLKYDLVSKYSKISCLFDFEWGILVYPYLFLYLLREGMYDSNES